MPYSSNAELPKGVKSLPAEAQTIFRKAYNSIHEKNPDASEEKKMRMAWGAVHNAGYDQDGEGSWKKYEEDMTEEEMRKKMAGMTEEEKKKHMAAMMKGGDSTSVEIRERIVFDADARIRKTADGYLVASPRVARSGIQFYKGFEVGKPSMDEVRVYRPEDEVFSRASMGTYAHRPVTNDHPPVLIDATNWDKYAVGQTGDEVLKDGQFIRVPMVLMDAGVIRDIENGKCELSNGYTMDLKWTPGKTEAGEEYDAIQTKIRSNHIAVVDAARGGQMLAIGDTSHKETSMSENKDTKTIIVDGLPIEVNGMGASVITRYVERLQAQVQDANKAREGTAAAAQQTIEGKDAEIATLKKQLQDAEITPKRLDEMVADRTTVIRKARVLVGDRLMVAGRTLDDIMRQAVDKKLSNISRDWTADQIKTSFTSLTAGIKDFSEQYRPGSGDGGRNSLDDVLRDGVHSSQDAREVAYDDYVKRQENAWKTAGRQPQQQDQ